MKMRNGAIAALLFLTACDEANQNVGPASVESAPQALGKSAASEVATWLKVGGAILPDGRYLQAMAFDETRKLAVMFGGVTYNPSSSTATPTQEIWEWSPTTGDWTDRSLTGAQPAVRSGAAMVFDSLRNKFVLFGGRAGSGFNYQDMWEWDPTTGIWTDLTSSGSRPAARSQHAMVYEKSTGKILLFGGGRSDSTSTDGTGISVSFGDTWEWDAKTHAWTQLLPTTGPTARHDFGLVWDATRKKAVLFGGMEKDSAGVDGSPKQDTWEWDPATSTWTERTTAGTKPSARYGHSMAFAGGSNKVFVFGGWDIGTGWGTNDLWDWDPTSGAWTSRLTGTETGIPSARMYASLVSVDANARLELIAGATTTDPNGGGGAGPGGYGWLATREIWEIDPATYTCTDRSSPSNAPLPRSNSAMAYNPTTGKTYVFGGMDIMQVPFDDLWEWDGKTWTKVATTDGPSARSDAGLAYDPVRKSLILYGGQGDSMAYGQTVLGDTWEWNSTTRLWKQIFPTTSPDPLYGHGMVTDTTRNKILLFAGMSNYVYYPYPPMPGPGYKDPMRNEVWEWDGTTTTWTNRTPFTGVSAPSSRQYPVLAYDEDRKKLFVQEPYAYYGTGGYSAFWEWDPISTGWAIRDSGDNLSYGTPSYATYDSNRRREVVFGDMWSQTGGIHETWELDAKGPTWYVRAIQNSPTAVYNGAMVFDRARGVVVLFGGNANGYPTDETWEYGVTGLGNGEGCVASTAATCASGNCVDGVCCDSKACTGPCKSCNVSGHEGTCVLALAGTEVPGSCSSGQACDGSGNCKASNGQACTSASTCASGFCVDGVCCNSGCDGTCVSCNQAGLAGKCSPFTAGTDPGKECSTGTGTCKSACDGVGACAMPPYGTTCGNCMFCDGAGSCDMPDPSCGFGTGGSPGYGGSTGYGGSPGYGGSTGYGGITARGGTTSRGGTTGTGGVPPTGGIFISGGINGTGGISPTGGIVILGGITGTGGTLPYGGNIGGASPNGGSIAFGGSTGRGGTTISGGATGYGGSTALGGSIANGGTIAGSGGINGQGGAGGHGGSGDAGIGTGGSTGNGDAGPPGLDGGRNRDAQGLDGAMTLSSLHRAGCNCELGGTTPADPGLATPIFLGGVALVLRRIRRTRR